MPPKEYFRRMAMVLKVEPKTKAARQYLRETNKKTLPNGQGLYVSCQSLQHRRPFGAYQ